MKKIVFVVLMAIALAGCASDASVISTNLSKAADQFEITRRVIFYNGVTGEYMLVIEGLCSIEDQVTQLEVVCKTGKNSYKKHFLGLSDNVTYFAEHLESTTVDKIHYRVIFKPESIIPTIDWVTSLGE